METILTPYGINVMNKDHPTRVQNQSRTLIDYIITNHLKTETFETYVSDSVFRTSKNKSIDHRATSIVSNLQIEKQCKVTKRFLKKVIIRDVMCFVKRFKEVIGLGSTARKVLKKRRRSLMTSLKIRLENVSLREKSSFVMIRIS